MPEKKEKIKSKIAGKKSDAFSSELYKVSKTNAKNFSKKKE